MELLIGKPIPNDEAEEEKIGPLAGIPVLGLDALASAAYGPEVALTLLVLGADGSHSIGPSIVIISNAWSSCPSRGGGACPPGQLPG